MSESGATRMQSTHLTLVLNLQTRDSQEIGDMVFLVLLDLSSNNLTGNLPGFIGRRPQDLKYAYFGSNRFGGELPTELGLLTNLVELYLNDNPFGGVVPNSFSNLINLRELGLEMNQFNGGLDTLFCDRDPPLDEFIADCTDTAPCECCTECQVLN